MDTNGKTIISAQIDNELRAALKQKAVAADRSLSAEIRRALVEHLQHIDQAEGEW